MDGGLLDGGIEWQNTQTALTRLEMATPLGDKAQFIIANTAVLSPPHVPEIKLYLADEAHDLWHKTEEELGADGLQPPFWAFAWAGGQGLARYVLDHPQCVSGLRVLDFACGSGLVGIAAKMAGAKSVIAADIDLFCKSAVTLNSSKNAVTLEFSNVDLFSNTPKWLSDIDLVLAGDAFYDAEMVKQILPLFSGFVEAGKTVLIGDPGRAYLPKSGLEKLATYEIAVSRQLEDSEIKRTIVWQWQSA